MAKPYIVYVGVVTALVLCKYSLAEWNATEESANRTVSCHHHANRNNCTAVPASKDNEEWTDHFSKCPMKLKNYCIHGTCRYITDLNVPSCRCEQGYIGARCEYVDLDWQIGEKRHIVIACITAGLIFLILLIVFICICSHRRYGLCRRRGRRREEPSTEKLGMMNTGGTHEASMPDSTEPLHSNAHPVLKSLARGSSLPDRNGDALVRTSPSNFSRVGGGTLRD